MTKHCKPNNTIFCSFTPNSLILKLTLAFYDFSTHIPISFVNLRYTYVLIYSWFVQFKVCCMVKNWQKLMCIQQQCSIHIIKSIWPKKKDAAQCNVPCKQSLITYPLYCCYLTVGCVATMPSLLASHTGNSWIHADSRVVDYTRDHKALFNMT